MKIVYQPTLVPNVARAITLNYTDDETPARSICMFNASLMVSTDPSTKTITATVTRVDGDGHHMSDASGIIEATATDPASDDAAIKAAATALAPRVLPAPAISSISPSRGAAAGGDTVTISGMNFIAATALTFGGKAAESFTVDSLTQITAITPPDAAGQVDVSVTAPGGTATIKDRFGYV